MQTWEWMLYAAAAFLSLRTLLALMTAHRKRHLRKLIAEDEGTRKLAARSRKKPPRHSEAA